ncbi:AAA family ATPase [Peribacillus butanolivorans]|uniref:AAA family ATPase n=1 Tax=Peribacillus butanolivorans TaxID=421767 RepID=UPI00362BC8F8
MKILSMELENFRQYYGEQKINFASEDRNITIIFGENGKGKTGIFRALMFALYNATHIQQDNPSEKIHLVNLRLLEEKLGTMCKASVTVLFEHNGNKYEISRSIAAVKAKNRIQERNGSVKFYEIDCDGNYSPTPIEDTVEVGKMMNQILDEDIKDFFLFDGEKIDTLAKTNDQVKREVKSAIFKLLQIDNVEEARVLLNNLKNTEQRNVVNRTTDVNTHRKQEEIDEVVQNIAQQKEILSKFTEELTASNELIQKYELQLSQNKEIGIIQEKLKLQEDMRTALVEHLKSIKSQIGKLVYMNMPYLLLNDVFHNVSNYLQGTISENDSNVPLEVIEESLQKNVCLCCNNNLEVHQENRAFIELLKQNYKRLQSNEDSKAILRMINSSSATADETKEKAIELLREFDAKEREIRKIEEIISEVQKEIGNKANEQLNLEQTNTSLQKQRQNSKEVEAKIAQSTVRIEDLKVRKETLQQQLDRIIKENQSNAFEQQVIDVIKLLSDDISAIAQEFSTDMRIKLKNSTTEIFKRLIDQKDVNLIKEININDKFELEIFSHDDIEITQDISQGQRQIVALAFITALAQVAAGDSEQIAFPLFMDSPFNRLSGVNRDQLIENIPSLTSQWILLLTDTELTTSEERVVKEGGRLGKWYRINQIDTFHSEIEEVSLVDSMTTRGM